MKRDVVDGVAGAEIGADLSCDAEGRIGGAVGVETGEGKVFLTWVAGSAGDEDASVGKRNGSRGDVDTRTEEGRQYRSTGAEGGIERSAAEEAAIFQGFKRKESAERSMMSKCL